jgi:RNA polymerase sigma factor (sigma-70 family)
MQRFGWGTEVLMAEGAVLSSVQVDQISLSETIISDELLTRPIRAANICAENSALESLAIDLPAGKDMVLKRLARLAIELCGAGSAGVSVLEEGNDGEWLFRWQALAGVIESYEGGSTPRHWSPCGTCLDAGVPVLYSYPARHFTYFRELATPIVEGLVIPMFANRKAGATIWIVSHTEDRRFDAEDVRVMTTLGNFASRALSLTNTGISLKDQPGHGRLGDREEIWRDYVFRIAQGDHAALTALFNETSPLVFATAMRIVAFRADAEEITGDVYAKLWRIARCYESHRGSVVGWLRTISRNLSFDHLRSRATRARHEVALSSECGSHLDLESHLITGQADTRILAALEALPFAQRQAIELVYYAGLTSLEIAEELKCPVGTVKTRLRLALQKLRRILAATV